MTRVARQHGAINLAQGFPDFPAPEGIKEAAVRALRADVNQYAVTWGAPELRQAIAGFMAKRRGVEVDPETQITVCCGATEAMMAAMLGVLDPGDEVLIPEPFYENYGPDGVISGAVPVFVPMGPGFRLDIEAMEKAITAKTRAVVFNTPHNPTGRVFQKQETEALYDLIRRHDLLLFTDEIYEEILYTGRHQSPLLEPGMAERTLAISGASKTFSVTGWRVGWVISPPALTSGVRKVHDFLTVGAPAPLQQAVAEALHWDDDYFEPMRREYQQRRDLLVAGLQQSGFACESPEGAYYVMADCRPFQRHGENDVDFALRLIRECGVATVPGSSFYQNPEDGAGMIRFCYAKRVQTLEEAVEKLQAWIQTPSASC
ncbi:MAG: aminotransferase class I/II-fold pyridoxal phosphate-dependent enzyme [Planctomycetota bacterium]|nr:MAG: aminotransferase class I/II-fold pyridoxal phosphate-dependent enzyme [Planctomycetota bacterium]